MPKIAANIFTGKDSLQHFFKFISLGTHSQVFVLVDENTKKYCYPKIKKQLPKHSLVQIKSGEKNKTLSSCEAIWGKLTTANADRNSLLINLGGGVISDLGGFAAGCYKRGIKFVNVPTTLLAMVDASVGAKTGIDFNSFKNQIGLFNEPEAVFIHTDFLKTLTDRELRAGMAEVVKHYMLADAKAFYDLANLLLKKANVVKPNKIYGLFDWDELIKKNIAIKTKIVSMDKFETGERKALNFGHTIGHAIETYFLNAGKQILHGEAIMLGIICETSLSISKKIFPRKYFPYIIICKGTLFPYSPFFRKQSIRAITKFIKQDKKNVNGKTMFTLSKGPGSYLINQQVETGDIINALEYCAELTYQHK